jgi:hypothetical protein
MFPYQLSVLHELPGSHKEWGFQFATWVEVKYEIFINVQFFGQGLFSSGRDCKQT